MYTPGAAPSYDVVLSMLVFIFVGFPMSGYRTISLILFVLYTCELLVDRAVDLERRARTAPRAEVLALARELDADIVRGQRTLRPVLLSAVGLRVSTSGFFFIIGLGFSDPLGLPSAFCE